jgi:hypothetical protein
MDGRINANLMSNAAFELDAGQVKGQSRVIDFYKGFRSELGDLMKNLMNDEEDLSVGNYLIPAAHKHGAAGTYAINEWLSEQEFVFSQLLESIKFEQNLENKANNLFAA